MATIPNTLRPVRDGDWLLIVIPNYWGKGATMAEAKRKLIEVAGSRATRSPKAWRVYSVDKTARLDDIAGSIYHAKDHNPIVVAEYDPPK